MQIKEKHKFAKAQRCSLHWTTKGAAAWRAGTRSRRRRTRSTVRIRTGGKEANNTKGNKILQFF